MRQISLIVLCGFLTSCAYGQVAMSTKFNEHTTSGHIRPGINADEVTRILGKPRKVASRKTQADIRSVWAYREYRIEHPVGFFFIGLVTLGMGFLFPATPEDHYMVFSDSTLIGWDIPDPYAPDLIIEKRER